MTSLRDLLRVDGGVDLPSYDTSSTPGFRGGKRDGVAALARQAGELGELQERLYAQGTRSILLVLQGIDSSGKDGTVRHVISLVNPQGVRITAFKAPSEQERRLGYLWRIRRALPAAGEIGVFNRSQYEDVIVPTVHATMPADRILPRYDEINAFEAGLVAAGTAVVKVFLAISYDEQRARLLARLREPAKRWKFSEQDLRERALWPSYTAAYETMLTRCSTPAAPWYVVPADRKWYRNWAVGTLLRETLADLDPQYPQPPLDLPALEARLLES